MAGHATSVGMWLWVLLVCYKEKVSHPGGTKNKVKEGNVVVDAGTTTYSGWARSFGWCLSQRWGGSNHCLKLSYQAWRMFWVIVLLQHLCRFFHTSRISIESFGEGDRQSVRMNVNPYIFHSFAIFFFCFQLIVFLSYPNKCYLLGLIPVRPNRECSLVYVIL